MKIRERIILVGKQIGIKDGIIVACVLLSCYLYFFREIPSITYKALTKPLYETIDSLKVQEKRKDFTIDSLNKLIQLKQDTISTKEENLPLIHEKYKAIDSYIEHLDLDGNVLLLTKNLLSPKDSTGK